MKTALPVSVAPAVLLAPLLGGCVERVMKIDSDPPGALVYLNDQEVGRTPVEKEFLWYGTYDLQLRKEGYRTLSATPRVWAPFWQIVPIDLLVELLPFTLVDRATLSYQMRPMPEEPPSSEELIGRAVELRGRLQSSEYRKPLNEVSPEGGEAATE
jgi:hypothetical protein